MSNIANTTVYGLSSSIFRSGYPMRDRSPSTEEFLKQVQEIDQALRKHNLSAQHIKRAIHLANAKGGGHDQFLTGIIVNFDLTFPNKAWVEAERYRFLSFISSMSTMHRIAAFPIRECCNAHVSEQEIYAVETAQIKYNQLVKENASPHAIQNAYLDLLYQIPSGFELMAGMTTNYRCLKNIYEQRRHHCLPDWHVFCDWIESLPLAPQLICGQPDCPTAYTGCQPSILSYDMWLI